MQTLMSSWDVWLTAFEQCYKELPEAPRADCPNCGAERLRLLFTGPVDKRPGPGAKRSPADAPADQATPADCPAKNSPAGGSADNPADKRLGYASFWCDACLFGVHLSRCLVPDGVPMESLDTPVGQRAVRVPDYTLLWPDETDEPEANRGL